jgi:hypothetical protein
MNTTTRRRTPARLPVLIAIAAASVCQGEILNPSFEQIYRPQGSLTVYPEHWLYIDQGTFGCNVTGSWASEGNVSAYIYSRLNNAPAEGEFRSFYQEDVDLTQVTSIVFDVVLLANGQVPDLLFDGYEAALLVNGVVVWSETQDGEYYDMEASVSQFSGPCTIELRNTALANGDDAISCWTLWDNLRLIESVEIEAELEIKPKRLWFWPPRRWVWARVELPKGYSVDDIDDASVTLEVVGADPAVSVMAETGANNAAVCGKTGDDDGDGILDRTFKFRRPGIKHVLKQMRARENMTVMVSGTLADGTVFRGTDTVRTFDKKKHLERIEEKKREHERRMKEARARIEKKARTFFKRLKSRFVARFMCSRAGGR